MLKFEEVAVVTPLLLEQIKLTETLDFIPFKSLLIFNIYLLSYVIIVLELFVFIGTIICFLERPLVIMLSFGLSFNPLLVILWILIILSKNDLEKVSLILIISLILLLKACIYIYGCLN